MQLHCAMAILPANCNTIKKWLQEHLPIATKATHIATQFIHGNLVTYCHHFTERLQYDLPIGPKLVALQFCLVALGQKSSSVVADACWSVVWGCNTLGVTT
jgi:hypothetical protein